MKNILFRQFAQKYNLITSRFFLNLKKKIHQVTKKEHGLGFKPNQNVTFDFFETQTELEKNGNKIFEVIGRVPQFRAIITNENYRVDSRSKPRACYLGHS